jgi:sec-independent protein translocase protein TatA
VPAGIGFRKLGKQQQQHLHNTRQNIMFGTLGTTEIILIVIIVLVLFGGRKIPELMKGLGSGIKEFKKATNDEDETATARRNDDDRRYDDRRGDDRRYDDRRIDDRRSDEGRYDDRRADDRDRQPEGGRQNESR